MGMRILVVEDNTINRELSAELLRMLGAEVEVAQNGRQAVEAVLGHPALYYDAVLMDIQMPVMDGYEAARRIRASGLDRIEELPILAITADAFADDIRQAMRAGMDGHLAKPVLMEQLRKALACCTRRKRRFSQEEQDAGRGREESTQNSN